MGVVLPNRGVKWHSENTGKCMCLCVFECVKVDYHQLRDPLSAQIEGS
jgi:hypothetical protein